jgi:chromosome partitioning protein
MMVAILNTKGGVGKTTTAVNLAAGLATPRRRVLLVDLDSQGSASLALGVARADLAPSAAEVLLDGLPVRQAIRPTAVPGLDLLTGAMTLANADLVLGAVAGREQRLRTALEPVRDAYRFILLDCPPSLSLVPINALVASDALLVPVTPQYLAIEGLVTLLDAVARLQARMGTNAALLGLLLTLVDARARATRDLVAMLRAHYGAQVWQTEIPVNVRLSEAPSFGHPIFTYAGRSAGAQAYRRLVPEFLARCRQVRLPASPPATPPARRKAGKKA